MKSVQGLKQFGLIAEVIIISTVLSYLIKYGGPYLQIAGTSQNAVIAVLLPTVVMAIALFWRYKLASQRSN